jgi:outer membrane receptor protein involved in Fe transport
MSRNRPPAPIGKSSPPEEIAVPEILVTGRRTHNADVRRTENDIQPYKVSTRQEVERSQRRSIEEFMRASVPVNAQARSPDQEVAYVFKQAITSSAVDLRGLGRRRTLVLVDGRRMPQSLDGADFNQPDLNGIPLNAIERIETLTGTAGGIYGPDALGGVVNVILKRDYDGADLHASSGITSRGDAMNLRLDGRLGFSLNEGRTRLMLLAAHRVSEPLLAGQRDFDLRARQRQFANDPLSYVQRHETANSVLVSSQSGQNLVLDPAFGGRSLGAPFTYLPVGFSGTREQAIVLLEANAGKIDLELPRDNSGAFRSLVSTAEVTSGLLNLRHRFSDRLEAYADAVLFRNKGSFRNGLASQLPTTSADAPSNPFTERVFFRYPLPAREETERTLDTARFGAGAILTLSSQWSVVADYSFGSLRQRVVDGGLELPATYVNALRSGATGFGGLPPIDPLGKWDDLSAATSQYLKLDETSSLARNRFSDASIRLAGPLMRTEAGPVTLSLLAESRRERSAPWKVKTTCCGAISVVSNQFKQIVSSAYAELRTPLTDAGARILPGLELQVAARFDQSTTTFPRRSMNLDQKAEPLIQVKRDSFNFTLGGRFHPMPRLMLRASVATGELYPTVEQLTPRNSFRRFNSPAAVDPLRGGERIGGGELVSVVSLGSPELKSERGRTMSLGAIFNALGRSGPRISIDYSRVDIARQVSPFFLSPEALLNSEAMFPSRVVRDELTDLDAARGFTVGRVIEINLTPINDGRTIDETIDVEFDWLTRAAGGIQIQLYGSGTWQPRLSQRKGAGQPWLKRAGAYDGPLRWRGNIGAEWQRGRLAIGVNLQAFDGYRVTYADVRPRELLSINNEQTVRYQGGNRVPRQAYVDMTLRRRFLISPKAAPIDGLEIRFGIQNVFDKRPPTVANEFDVPYSTYGDARRRRFELTLSAEL